MVDMILRLANGTLCLHYIVRNQSVVNEKVTLFLACGPVGRYLFKDVGFDGVMLKRTHVQSRTLYTHARTRARTHLLLSSLSTFRFIVQVGRRRTELVLFNCIGNPDSMIVQHAVICVSNSTFFFHGREMLKSLDINVMFRGELCNRLFRIVTYYMFSRVKFLRLKKILHPS